MAFLEKSNWVVLIVAVPTLILYAILVVPQLATRQLADVAWVQPMIVAIVGFIVANVAGNIVAAISNPHEADRHDQRDTDIDRFGERFGNWALVAGSCAALVLAMARADHFWIANAVFLGGMAGAVISSVTKIAAYHTPFQQW